jgi:glycosyltransferase involved in cell wall biosynthesis
MLESMACGTPVAAYPVDGPTEVVGDDQGGALREHLDDAWSAAIACPRQEARARAQLFGWSAAVDGFVSALVPVRSRQAPQDARAESADRHVSVTKTAATGSIIDI